MGMWVPCLVAVGTSFALILCIVGMKYATMTVGIDPKDFNYGFSFCLGFVLQILAVIYFTRVEFTLRYWIWGTIGSTFLCAGAMLATCAYNTGAALGPMTCL